MKYWTCHSKQTSLSSIFSSRGPSLYTQTYLPAISAAWLDASMWRCEDLRRCKTNSVGHITPSKWRIACKASSSTQLDFFSSCSSIPARWNMLMPNSTKLQLKPKLNLSSRTRQSKSGEIAVLGYHAWCDGCIEDIILNDKELLNRLPSSSLFSPWIVKFGLYCMSVCTN